MGKPTSESNKTASNALAIQLDAEGKIKYDVLARQGHSKDKTVYSKYTDLLPKEMSSENDPVIFDITLIRYIYFYYSCFLSFCFSGSPKAQ